jgi:interleukin-1 receptor-associated kinase 1
MYRRYKVAIDIAKALDHLHGRNCIHRDIKPSNVMLDEHFNAKLGDFGLVVRRIIVTGDSGYTDPESIRTGGRAGKASDIYSFGVLLLEIACGIRPACRQDQGRNNANTLVQKARMCYARGALLDAVDERLDGNFVTAQVQLVMRVGLLCVQDGSSTRPNCRQVLNYLSGTVPPPSPRKDQDSLAIQGTYYAPSIYNYVPCVKIIEC